MEKELRRQRAEQIINTNVIISCGCGAIPIGLLDIAATTGIQLNMLSKLCSVYDIEYNKEFTKGLIFSLAGSIAKRTIASTIKSVPFVGSFIGGISQAFLSAASTYALGHAFIKYMELNQTAKSITEFNTNLFKDNFTEFMQQKDKVVRFVKSQIGLSSTESDKTNTQEQKIYKLGEAVFGNNEKFAKWLNSPKIDGRTPLELILNKEYESVLKELNSLNELING